MKIKFKEITDEGLYLKIMDQAWFPEQELSRCGPVSAEVNLERKGEKLVLMDGLIEGALFFDCDRCLMTFEFPLQSKFKIDLELFASPGRFLDEHQCSAKEMDTVYLTEPEIDIFQVLSQQVLLNLPLKRICAEACRGFCSRCGADLNIDDCGCRDNSGANPFSILAGLKKQEK